MSENPSSAEITELHSEAIRAIADSERIIRRAAKARVKADQAANSAEELGGPPGQQQG